MKKGKMARRLVYFCVSALTFVLLWAMVIKTVALFIPQVTVDLTDVLTFTAAAFGGELLLLAFKRIFAKPKKRERKHMNKIIQKLTSRKLWMAIAGVATGIALVLGVDGGDITNVAGAITAVASVITYIVTEGKIDAESVKNALESAEEAKNSLMGGE